MGLSIVNSIKSLMKEIEKFKGLYKQNYKDRLNFLVQCVHLEQDDKNLLEKFYHCNSGVSSYLSENIISCAPVPLGIAPYFLINNKEYIIPMCTEEPTVIAGASNAAKLARASGGFGASASESLMIGQVQIVNIPDCTCAIKSIKKNIGDLIRKANKCDPVLIEHNGGVRDIKAKTLETSRGLMLIIELMVDVQDAMGANIVIKMAETIAPDLEKITGGEIRARIVSNLAQNRLAYAQAVWRKNILGESLIESILDVYEFAKCDESRAVTHNKGIMNGICAVALATGNDTRALEAGAHGFAVKNGRYNPLTNYKKDKEGNLIGNIELPITVGTVGYSINNNPMAQICFKILGVKCAKEFACVLAAVGLAQNFAALRVLAGEGLLKGHKKLSSYKKRDKSGKSLESCSCLSA